ncbi:hypothetical protein BHE74_00008535 [Ensete ventricosum]|nr:hypothetical protein BHE74_00008535 [Ensete ventricosum]
MVGTESPLARLRAYLSMVGTESPLAILRACLSMVGTESPEARLRARLLMVETESPWARLRARLSMVGTESPWARLRSPYFHHADASRSTTVVPSGKGKELVPMEEAPEQGYTLRQLCEVEDHVWAERYFATVMMRLKVRWGFHFITARINRVHDAGRLVRSQHERILALRAANKELKGRVDQDLVTIAKAHGTGWVNYEFGYRVALERLWGKHPKVEVEQDPFAECPEDANVMMDLS